MLSLFVYIEGLVTPPQKVGMGLVYLSLALTSMSVSQ